MISEGKKKKNQTKTLAAHSTEVRAGIVAAKDSKVTDIPWAEEPIRKPNNSSWVEGWQNIK